jgi:hypothetical protein
MNYDCRPNACTLDERRANQTHRERTHKHKSIIFSQIDHFDRQGSRIDYRYCLQWLTATFRRFLANSGWNAAARLLKWGANLHFPDSAFGGGRTKPNEAMADKSIIIKCLCRNRGKRSLGGYSRLNQQLTAILTLFFWKLLPTAHFSIFPIQRRAFSVR